MGIVLYGSPHSRTMRVLWMATELRLDYQHVPYEYDDHRLKQPEFLRLNPAGTIPTLVDGSFSLAESMAINLYLAKKYDRQSADRLYPGTAEGEASAIRWSLFAQGHLEPWVQKDLLLETRGHGMSAALPTLISAGCKSRKPLAGANCVHVLHRRFTSRIPLSVSRAC